MKVPDNVFAAWKDHGIYGERFKAYLDESACMAKNSSKRGLKRASSSTTPQDLKRIKVEPHTPDLLDDDMRDEANDEESLKRVKIGNTGLEAKFYTGGKIIIHNLKEEAVTVYAHQELFGFMGVGTWRHAKDKTDQVYTRKLSLSIPAKANFAMMLKRL